MDVTAQQPDAQLGLLDLSVDLSVPEIYSGTDFTLYLHVKNPFSRPVWIKSVELSLPTQLSARDFAGSDKGSTGDRLEDSFLRERIRDRENEIKRIRRELQRDEVDQEVRERREATIRKLENEIKRDRTELAGGLILESTGGTMNFGRVRTSNLYLNAEGDATINIGDFQTSKSPERVRLLSSLPSGAALQPGSTDVWTIRLGTHKSPLFIPARYRLQLTVIYSLEAPSDDESREMQELYANTTSFTTQVRAAIWSVILGGALGGLAGSLGHSFQSNGLDAFDMMQLGSTVGAIILAIILSGAAVVFSVRKSEAQSFVTVEDFWGGVLIGFLIGYSGTTAFSKITGS